MINVIALFSVSPALDATLDSFSWLRRRWWRSRLSSSLRRCG